MLAGLGLNQFYGLQGELHLEVGKVNSMKAGTSAGLEQDSSSGDLGLSVTLDSLRVNPFTPVYEIKLSKKDTVKAHSEYQPGPVYSMIGLYPLEQMKIIEIEKSDFRFRLKEFYPNFQFAYQYPSERDTIAPRAPGITLELKTKEGSPIVTLRSDQPKKHLLGDIVSLGASLAFYWNIPMDSIKEIAANNSNAVNKVVFSGADTTVYFILLDSIQSQPLKENMFYKIPGQDSSGFTILFCYPDINYLMAVPSSKGSDLINPVAHVEIWKEGGSAKDAFVYPETRSKKGGDFDIPGTDYRIGLGTNKELARHYCDCIISIKGDSTMVADTLTLLAGKPAIAHGYRFTPLECKNGYPGGVIMEVRYLPGRIPIIIGFSLAGIAILLFLIRRAQANKDQTA